MGVKSVEPEVTYFVSIQPPLILSPSLFLLELIYSSCFNTDLTFGDAFPHHSIPIVLAVLIPVTFTALSYSLGPEHMLFGTSWWLLTGNDSSVLLDSLPPQLRDWVLEMCVFPWNTSQSTLYHLLLSEWTSPVCWFCTGTYNLRWYPQM